LKNKEKKEELVVGFKFEAYKIIIRFSLS